ncbi:MAG: hypothetical protein M1827_000417 [Pycnora praestabilis]|nr:MAG: hypothetical protein M1827_000417 [Pycnora praestabilis]
MADGRGSIDPASLIPAVSDDEIHQQTSTQRNNTAAPNFTFQEGFDDGELNRPEGANGRRGDHDEELADAIEGYGYINGQQYESAPIISENDSEEAYREGANASDDDDEQYEQPLRLLVDEDYYSILGLSRSPSPPPAQIRSAFHSLSLRFHPDKHPPRLRKLAEKQYAKIQRAYEVLIDPRRKVVYDLLGAEGVQAEWGPGGSMAKGGESQRMQVSFKSMTSEEFRTWFLKVMRNRERKLLEDLVASGREIFLLVATMQLIRHEKGQINVRFSAIPLFHPYLFRRSQSPPFKSSLFPRLFQKPDQSLSSDIPPPVQLTNLSISHHFRAPLPFLDRVFNAPLYPWKWGTKNAASAEEAMPRREPVDFEGDEVPQLTIATSMGGKSVQLTTQSDQTSDNTDQHDQDLVFSSIPAILARSFSLGFSMNRAFPKLSTTKATITPSVNSILQDSTLDISVLTLPNSIVRVENTRLLSVVEGTEPLLCSLKTTFTDNPILQPPALEVFISRRLGLDQKKRFFTSWGSGKYPWPGLISRVLESLTGIKRTASDLFPGGSEISMGIQMLPESSVLVASDFGQEGSFSTNPSETRSHLQNGKVTDRKIPTNETFSAQISASQGSGYISIVYGRDVFTNMSDPPLRSKQTIAGDFVSFEQPNSPTGLDRGVRLEIQMGARVDYSLDWTISGTKRVGDFTRIGVIVGVNQYRGLHISLSWSRLSQGFRVPVAVCPFEIISPNAIIWALAIPWGMYAALEFGILRPKARRDRQKLISMRKKELRASVAKRKEEAGSAVSLMRGQVERNQIIERERGGLVILEATYGVKENFAPTSDYKTASRRQMIEVTVATAALVQNGQLMMPRWLNKSLILGYYDPAPFTRKILCVRYLFGGKEHVVEVGEREPVHCPMREHEEI